MKPKTELIVPHNSTLPTYNLTKHGYTRRPHEQSLIQTSNGKREKKSNLEAQATRNGSETIEMEVESNPGIATSGGHTKEIGGFLDF